MDAQVQNQFHTMVRLKALAKIRKAFMVKSHNVFPIITDSVDEFWFVYKISTQKGFTLTHLLKIFH